jgi:hypothetical protein
MADLKISALPAATTPLAGTEVLPIVQSGSTDKVSVADLTAGRAVSAASIVITNTGAGDSFLVEDSTSPDSTPVVIDSSGDLIVGYTANITTVNALTSGIASIMPGSSQIAYLASRFQDNSTDPKFVFSKARGTVTAPTIVANADGLGAIWFAGYDGASYIRGAQIECEVGGTPGTNDMPGRLTFSTTAAGASTPTERMRITSTGQTTISGNTIISVTDNTNAALRITQLGTGNALLVEDSTNPDSTPFVIDNRGDVLVGTTTIRSVGNSFQTSTSAQIYNELTSTDLVGFTTVLNRNDSNGTRVVIGKSRGTTVGSVTSLAASDVIGQIMFAGADGTTLNSVAAQISGEVDGTPGTNDMPGRLVFSTTADGASTSTERMRIDSAGNIGIDGAASAGVTISIPKAQTGATSATTISARMNPLVDVTTNSTGYTTFALNGVGASTTNFFHYTANQGTFAGTAPTNQFGFNASNALTGATNNFGVYSAIAAGTNRFNFYATGTAINYFAGVVQTNAATAIPAGGTAGAGVTVSSTANFGVFFGSGAPTLSAAKGSLYLRSDGSTVNDRMYVNTNGSTTWTNLVTAA